MRQLLVVSCLLLCIVAIAWAQPTDHRGAPLDDYEQHRPGALMYLVGAGIVLWVGYNTVTMIASIIAWLAGSARKRLRDDPKIRSRVYQLLLAGAVALLTYARIND